MTGAELNNVTGKFFKLFKILKFNNKRFYVYIYVYFFFTGILQQILRMLAVLNVSHKEVKQRLKKLEDVIKTFCAQKISNLENEDLEIIKQFLPLETIDTVRKFEEALRTKEIAIQFVSLQILLIIINLYKT